MFETIGKLYLYLAMITDSCRIPVIANNFVIFLVDVREYIRSWLFLYYLLLMAKLFVELLL